MAKVENGKIVDPKIELKIYPSLEHGELKRITSIVLHRTDSSTASSTLGAYAGGKKEGAHFLIDGNGKIYQTTSLNKICWHVGILLPRCLIEKGCDPKELKTINALIHEKGLSFGRRAQNLSEHEARKSYPLRYPSNSDSIGIEVVGKFWPSKKAFDGPTAQQFSSTRWLVDVLTQAHGLNLRSNVYAHGAIARKEESEGAQLLQYLHSGVAP